MKIKKLMIPCMVLGMMLLSGCTFDKTEQAEVVPSIVEEADNTEQTQDVVTENLEPENSEQVQETVTETEEVNTNIFANVNIGDLVEYGEYEQNNNLDEKEPIVWEVVAVEDGKALLMSKYVLDCKPYYIVQSENEAIYDARITWNDSYLKKWLNEDFYSTAFSDDEYIIDASSDGTVGRVFTLSLKEIKEYLIPKSIYADTSDQYIYSSDKLFAEATPFAEAQGAINRTPDQVYPYMEEWGLTEDSKYCVMWWYREDGITEYLYVPLVQNWSVCDNGCGSYSIDTMAGVRPFIWVETVP